MAKAVNFDYVSGLSVHSKVDILEYDTSAYKNSYKLLPSQDILNADGKTVEKYLRLLGFFVINPLLFNSQSRALR